MADSFFVIAIDFGTAYSGYCYSVKADASDMRNPFWGKEYGLRFSKTPTCVLFNENKEFEKFGFDAVMAYKNMSSKEALRHYFFENFKMELYNKELTPDLMISTKDGKLLPALTVFSESLRYLKNHALDEIEKNLFCRFTEEDITWVLTVPAVWGPEAKQFMRLIAKKSGLVKVLNSESLILALEPEAASLWCKQLPSSGFIAERGAHEILETQKGTKYIVVDCGGGTIDITVHEVLENGFLKELQKASGRGWGGSFVDNNFRTFLREVFGEDVWDVFEKNHPLYAQSMMYNFSIQKCTENHAYIFFSCVLSLIKLAEQKQEISHFFKDIDGVSWCDGNIKMAQSKFESFFEDKITHIINAIKDIMEEQKNQIDTILLVGGYASCKILRDAVRSTFREQCKVLCPVDSHLAIAKGAILFGNNPKIIMSRVSSLTYGLRILIPFDPSIHDKEKITVDKAGDTIFCNDIFMKLVEKGQSVNINDVCDYVLKPLYDDQQEMHFAFFSTEQKDPMYTDEPGMKQIGSFVVPMPVTKLGRQRNVRLDIKFGTAEITATATDLSSNETQNIILEFLTESKATN
ncbi:heat shock 70 kDa protein 12A-like [Polypterus senegalus]